MRLEQIRTTTETMVTARFAPAARDARSTGLLLPDPFTRNNEHVEAAVHKLISLWRIFPQL
jgi:hypothetical protein